MRLLLSLVLLLSMSAPALAEEVRVCAYNVESDGAWDRVVKGRIEDMYRIDLWALSEVKGKRSAALFKWAAEKEPGRPNFRYILGKTGKYDRLVILYNTSKFRLLKTFELDHINPGGVVRSPLVAHLKLRRNGAEFLFMANHLYRSKAKARHKQARQLNAWARKQRLPLITAGDFNFDWDIRSGRHDKGYDELTRGGVFKWVRPAKLHRTQAARNTVLDFIFVAGAARRWRSESWIIVRDGDFRDPRRKSDHRPVVAKFDVKRRF